MSYVTRDEPTEQLATVNARAPLWNQALSLVEQQPVLGYGVGASRGLLLDSTGLGGGHNAVVNVLLDAGVIGAAAWVGLLWVLFGQLRRLRGRGSVDVVGAEASVLLGLLVCLLVDGMTYEGLGSPANVAIIWLFAIVAWTNVLDRGELDVAVLA